MAKKSNKTEHVLKLITKNEEDSQDDFFSLEKETVGNSSAAVLNIKKQASEVSQKASSQKAEIVPDSDLKYEAKLEIEIQPEIKVKQKEPAEEKQKEPAEEKQKEPVEVKPIEPVEVKPIEPVEVKQLEPAEANPIESVDPKKKENDEAPKGVQDNKEREEETRKDAAPADMGKVLPYDRGRDGSVFFQQHGNLVNIAELLAKERIALVMDRMKVCTCPTCVNDVLALTLNSLPTKYVTTESGKQYFQLDAYKKQYETDVLAALTKACVRVKASPRHEK